MKVLLSIIIWICFFPIALIMAMLSPSKKRRKRGGVMCGPGGSRPRGKKFRMTTGKHMF